MPRWHFFLQSHTIGAAPLPPHLVFATVGGSSLDPGSVRALCPAAAAQFRVGCDMKLHSVLLGWKKFLTKSCVSPQVLHGSMRLTGDARESVTVRGMKPSR